MKSHACKICIILAAGLVSDSLRSEMGFASTGSIPVLGKPVVFEHVRRSKLTCIDCFFVLVVDENESKLHHYLELTAIPFVKANPSTSLNESLKQAFSSIDSKYLMQTKNLQILFGDTLTQMDIPEDSIGVFTSRDPEDWSTVTIQNTVLKFERPGLADQATVAGAFSFSKPLDFEECLNSSTSFWDALKHYHSTVTPLSLFHLREYFDIGRGDTFYDSRKFMFRSRVDNSLSFQKQNNSIRKTSNNHEKIASEVYWFQKLPTNSKVFVPKLINFDDSYSSYELEYLPILTVAESLLCSRQTSGYWRRLVNSIDEALESLHSNLAMDFSHEIIVKSRQMMYFERLVSAIGYIEKLLPNIENMGFFVDDKETISWNEAKESWLRNSLQRQHFVPTFIHGDFFFGNIFFDQRLNMIKMIDPRGFFGEMQNYGDPLYDLAKLSHSVNGGYDLLSADIFRIFENSNQLNLQTARINSYSPVSDLMQSVLLKHCRKQDKSWKDLRTLESMMFLTLIPLHHDSIDRQKAFVLTALMSLTEAKNGGRND